MRRGAEGGGMRTIIETQGRVRARSRARARAALARALRSLAGMPAEPVDDAITFKHTSRVRRWCVAWYPTL